MISVRAEGLGKAYRLYRKPFDSLKELFLNRSYSETHWALRDVTLEVAMGGSLGIVGDNGAGKSTLVRLLAGAIVPSTGRVERVGRVTAILSLGAGFHSELTGAENIRIGCAVLGLSPAETAALAPVIADFSELGSFLHRPVRTYSAGMKLRLGFSVATAVTPDVLVLDEHLSVGDQHFRFKCKRQIMALREAGCSIVMCTHDVQSVAEVCERALWLRDGRPAMLGGTEEVLRAYRDHVRARDAAKAGPIPRAEVSPPPPQHPADNYLLKVSLGGDCRGGQIDTGGKLELRIEAQLSEPARKYGVHVGIVIVRNDAVSCYGVSTKSDELSTGLHALEGGRYGAAFIIDHLPLLSGQYTFTVSLLDDRSPHVYHVWSGAAPFTVRHSGKEVGVSRIPHRWVRM
jgi:lipopolysaccharide transport system ATP-binding protein